MMPGPMRPELRLLLAGTLFSSGGAIIKGCAFSALHIAGLRAAVVALVILLLLPQSRRLNPRAALLLLPFCGATLLFVLANKPSSPGTRACFGRMASSRRSPAPIATASPSRDAPH